MRTLPRFIEAAEESHVAGGEQNWKGIKSIINKSLAEKSRGVPFRDGKF
jgi:hypothetical protein